jgi:hypothetical protein
MPPIKSDTAKRAEYHARPSPRHFSDGVDSGRIVAPAQNGRYEGDCQVEVFAIATCDRQALVQQDQSAVPRRTMGKSIVIVGYFWSNKNSLYDQLLTTICAALV